MKKKNNQISNFDRRLLTVLSVFCIFMMALSAFSGYVGGPLRMLADVTVIPLQNGINYVGSYFGDLTDNLQTMKELQAENEELTAQVEELTELNSTLQEETYELERLQELYQLDQNYADYEKTAAHVIGKDSGNWFSTFTIDKGSTDGIEVDMNVLADGGLAGIVTEVGATWATVRSIIDDSSSVSAMVLSTSDTCIVNGDLTLIDEGQIAFEQLANNENEVSVGDQIVTSHISDKYLQGILIGYVSEVSVESNNLTRSGYIVPAVDFSNIQEVLVITTTKAELTGTGEDADTSSEDDSDADDSADTASSEDSDSEDSDSDDSSDSSASDEAEEDETDEEATEENTEADE